MQKITSLNLRTNVRLQKNKHIPRLAVLFCVWKETESWLTQVPAWLTKFHVQKGKECHKVRKLRKFSSEYERRRNGSSISFFYLDGVCSEALHHASFSSVTGWWRDCMSYTLDVCLPKRKQCLQSFGSFSILFLLSWGKWWWKEYWGLEGCYTPVSIYKLFLSFGTASRREHISFTYLFGGGCW